MEELDKVTTERIKNPGRVEWGRKLGKMAKQRKEVHVEKPNVTPNYYAYGLLVVGAVAGIYIYNYKSQNPPKKLKLEEKPTERKFADF